MSNPPSQLAIRVDALNLSVTVIVMRRRGSAPIQCHLGSASSFFYRNNDRKHLVTNRHVVIDERNKFYPDNLVIHAQNVSN